MENSVQIFCHCWESGRGAALFKLSTAVEVVNPSLYVIDISWIWINHLGEIKSSLSEKLLKISVAILGSKEKCR